jgi:prevent-host-death family protein
MTIRTIVTIYRRGGAVKVEKMEWSVAEAKAKLSEVIQRAEKDGPQRITRHGEPAAVVVSSEEWERKTRRKGNLAEFLANSPLREAGLELKRRKEPPREIDL